MDYYKLIQKSIDYIERNLENEINLNEIAKESYMSLSNFYKLFFMYVGYSANEYIRLRRISLAASDLLNSNLRIIDISLKYQFDSVDSFSRAFKRITRFLPSEFKKYNYNFQFERIDIMAQFLEAEIKNLLQDSPNPSVHQLLCKTNHQIIKGKTFTDNEKKNITGIFLDNISDKNTLERFNKGVKAPSDGRIMYPLFYIPPYNGKKLITITGVMPKTHIFSANHYELEILRLLALWRPNEDVVKNMLSKTKERLRTTCYGNFCSTGECFEASIVTLRFLATVFPNEKDWITLLTKGIRDEIDNKPNGVKRRSGIYFYYWLTLTDIDLPIADVEIKRYQPDLVHTISRSSSYNLEYDKLFNPIAVYIARNCLSRLPEYNHIKEIEGYAGSDGRFHFDYGQFII